MSNPDYFTTDNQFDESIAAVDMTENDGAGDLDRYPYRDVLVRAGIDDTGVQFDKMTERDAAHAIAAVVQLYVNPDQPLTGYTDFLSAAELFVRDIELYGNLPEPADEPKSSDPLAALGI